MYLIRGCKQFCVAAIAKCNRLYAKVNSNIKQAAIGYI